MTLSDIALGDLASALSTGRDLDFDAAYGMAHAAAADPVAVSQKTGMQLPDREAAESFLIGEFLDRRAEIDTDRALRMTQMDVAESDMSTNDAAFAYAGMTDADIRKMQNDVALGDSAAAVRVMQKFYFG